MNLYFLDNIKNIMVVNNMAVWIYVHINKQTWKILLKIIFVCYQVKLPNHVKEEHGQSESK